MPRQHLTKDLLLLFAQGKLTGEARRRVIRHLLVPCRKCRQAFRQVAVSIDAAEEPDRALPRNLLTPQMLQAERTDALHLWHESLETLSSGHRLLLVRENPRYHTWGLQELLLERGKALFSEDPIQMFDLCHLSLEIVHRMPLDRYRRADVADLRAAALAAIANSKRLIGDLHGAEEAIEQSLESLEWGTGDPLDEANVLSVYGSLLTDLGRIDEALEVLGAGARDAREVGDTQLQAKLVLQQASSIGWYEPARGLELTRRALMLLEPGRNPSLDLIARYQLMFLRCEIGEVREARALFEASRFLFSSQKNQAFWHGRILQIEAALARQEGHLDACESVLRALLAHYGERGQQHDIALTTLDLAEVLTASRRFEEAQGLLENILPLFRQWRVNSDVLRAWLMIEEGVKGRALEAVSFREVSRMVRRAWFRV
jgi:tetratricopeptide (TPR) repeat protein